MGEGAAPAAAASPERPVPAAPVETAGDERATAPVFVSPSRFSATSADKVTVHPFSPALMAAGGGLSLAAALIAVPLANHAWTLRQRYASEWPTIPASDREAFDAARTSAYVAMGAAAALGALTGALTAWYFLGSTERDAFVRPAAIPLQGGASAGLTGQF
ncbi:MAG: hypothetical protein M3O36_08270, partial [Myxococcota bacterium]|nr:hypothetical protein [Myxococcota bacterium]